MRHIFYKSKERLTDNERWYLERYLKESKELRKAYNLKEAYCQWFKRAKEIGETDIVKVKEGLKHFYRMAEESGIPE